MSVEDEERAEAEERQLRRDAALMEELLVSRGYKRLCEMLQVTEEGLLVDILGPLTGVVDVLRQEYVKGSIKGLRQVRTLPRAIVDAAAKQFTATGDEEGGTGYE